MSHPSDKSVHIPKHEPQLNRLADDTNYPTMMTCH